jgi:PilZ domain
MESTAYCDEICGAKMTARAQRFPIRAIMHYRIIGESRWYVGTVENMSSTGVQFRGERVVPVDSSIEVTVNVPGSLAAGHSSKMVSRGKVVRISQDKADPETTVMAAALSRLRILRD